MSDPNPELNKAGQLLVVVAGFFAAVATLLNGTPGSTIDAPRRVVTLAAAVALAVRYWWVILLLDWPFRLARTSLLLLAWCALMAVAAAVDDARRWAFALAGLAAVGAATEAYNLATGQWRHPSSELARSLHLDHRLGLASALLAVAVLLGAGAWLGPRPLVIVAGALVLADWARLAEMVSRHRCLLRTEDPR